MRRDRRGGDRLTLVPNLDEAARQHCLARGDDVRAPRGGGQIAARGEAEDDLVPVDGGDVGLSAWEARLHQHVGNGEAQLHLLSAPGAALDGGDIGTEPALA